LLDDDEQAYYQARAEFKAQTDSEDYEQALSQYHRSAWYRDDTYQRKTINQQLKETFTSPN